MSETKKLSVKENMIWNSIGSFLYLFSQWLLTIIIVHLSGYEDAGILSLAMSLTNMFYCIAIYGIRNYQVSDIKEKYTSDIYVTTRILTSGVAFFCCLIFVAVNGYPGKTFAAIIVYMVFKLSEAMVDVFHGIDQRLFRMDIIGKSFILRAVATFLAFTAGIYFTKSLVLAIIMMAVTAHLSVLFYDVPRSCNLEKFRINCSKVPIINLLAECFPLVIYLFLSTTIGTIPRYFLEQFWGSEILGIYASIATPAVIVQVAASYLFNPFVTVFAEKYYSKDFNGFMQLFKKCMIGIILLSVVCLAGAKIFGDFGLKLLFGKSILEYSYLLIPVIICTILTALTWFLCTLLTVMHAFKGLLISNILAVGVCAVLSVVLIPKCIMDGVNYAMIGSLSMGCLALLIFGMIHFENEKKEC